MKLVPVVSMGCGTNTCPTVYDAEDGDVAVQGYVIAEPQIDGGLPQGEAVVRIPRQLLDDWAQLRAGR